MRTVRALVFVAIGLFLTVSPVASASARVVPLPSSGWRPGDVSLLAALQGTVEGSASIDDGCVWIQSDFGDRDPIAWPAGYTARFNPVTIFDASGHVVAREGDVVRVTGGNEPVDRIGPRCMLGHATAFFVDGAPSVIDDPGTRHVAQAILVGLGLVGIGAVVVAWRRRARVPSAA